ncbi:MAG: PEP-CTERM system TPR-repeat protein PrsT [Piscirickettsiaceae bacterium]|nr:MAG: PEP-CTERM system TPR-repeat protein PrsT [Piscirickettsiaceae bacterium]
MKKMNVKKILSIFLMLLSGSVLAELSPSDYYEDAVKRLNNKDAKGAIIQLKNAIKQSPNMLSAHVLLGKAYLQNGEAGNAQNELEKANELGADGSITFIDLAKAYLMQAKYHALIKNVTDNELSGKIQSDVLVYRGTAYLELGQLRLAKEAISKALSVDSTNGRAISVRALMLLRDGKFKRAEKAIVEGLKLDDKSADVWNVKASISHSMGQLEQALVEYGQVLAIEEKHLDARLARIGIYLDLVKDSLARQDVDYLRNEYKYEPRSAYLESIIFKRELKPAEALVALKESADMLRSMEPKIINDSRTLNMLAGLVFFDVKDFEQAKTYLEPLIKKYPNQLGARKILASIFFEEKKYQKSIDTLTPTLVESSQDLAATSLLSAAYLRNGQAELGTRLLEKILHNTAEKSPLRVNLAIGYNELGQQNKALAELQSIYKESPTQRVGTMLALMHHQRGEAKKALIIADELVEKEPDNLGLLHLLGTIQASLGQFDKAKSQFTKMAKIEGGKTASELNLGKLELAQGQNEKARTRYAALLNAEPSNVDVLNEMARLEDIAGNNEQRARWLEKIRSLRLKDWRVRLALANLYAEQKSYTASLEAVLEAKKIAPKNLLILQTVAANYLALGKRDDAKYTYGQMRSIALDASDTDALYNIARQQANMGRLQDAVETLSIALEYKPNNVQIQTRLAELWLRTNKHELAKNLIDNMRTARPKGSEGHRLLGDLLVNQGKASQSIKHYKKALILAKTSDNALALSLALSGLDKESQAIGILEKAKRAKYADGRVSVALTELYMKQGHFKKAANELEGLLKQSPNDPFILNNLANVYDLLNDKRALGLAKKAYSIAPTSADINDTYGWQLTKAGQFEKALPYLREAHNRNSSNLDVRFHIAKTLAELKRNKEALNELKELLRDNQGFVSKDEALMLEKELLKR